MTMISLGVVLLFLLLYVVLTRWRRHERAELGLGRGAVVAADDTREGAPTYDPSDTASWADPIISCVWVMC